MLKKGGQKQMYFKSFSNSFYYYKNLLMRHFLFLLMLIVFPFCKAIYQPIIYKVSGTIIGEYNREPIKNVKIYSESIYLGKTDSEGNFEVETHDTGTLFLTFKDFSSEIMTITIIEDGKTEYDLKNVIMQEGLTKAKFLRESSK